MRSFKRIFTQHTSWRHQDFLKLWIGETISATGSQVTAFAIPIIAALTLTATPMQMGLLTCFSFAPMLLLSLYAGVIIDRLPRRPMLIATSLGQAILLTTIPLAELLHFLRIEYPYLIALLSGTLTVFFEVAYQAYLPSLVEQADTFESNGKLEMSHALAQIVGPGLAGWLTQLITAPFAVLIDALSFLVSATFLGMIRKTEPRGEHQQAEQTILQAIGSGLQIVLHNRVLWSIAACNATINLFGSAVTSLAVLYVVHMLNIAPVTYGFITAAGSLGALLGSLASTWIIRRCGVGPTIIGSTLLYGIGGWLLPLAGIVTPELTVPLLLCCWFMQSTMLIAFNVTQVSLRQSITPWHLQGRMNASMRFLICSALPLGSLLGGWLGETIGLRPTLLLAAAGTTCAFLWVLCSPIAHIRDTP